VTYIISRYDVCGTAAVYFHRFYMFHSFTDFHRYVRLLHSHYHYLA